MKRKEPARVLLSIGTAVAAISWLIGSVVVAAPDLLRRRRPARVPVESEAEQDVRLASLDGLSLAATFRPGAHRGAPGVLFVHGVLASRHAVRANADWLAAHGYAVLAIDLRGHGESDPALCGFGWSEAQDVHAALAWLRRRQDGGHIAIIGISMGGAAALIGPLGPAPADAFVLQAVFATFRKTVRSRLALVAGRGLA